MGNGEPGCMCAQGAEVFPPWSEEVGAAFGLTRGVADGRSACPPSLAEVQRLGFACVKEHLPSIVGRGAAAGLAGRSSQPKVDDASLDDVAEGRLSVRCGNEVWATYLRNA